MSQALQDLHFSGSRSRSPKLFCGIHLCSAHVLNLASSSKGTLAKDLFVRKIYACTAGREVIRKGGPSLWGSPIHHKSHQVGFVLCLAGLMFRELNVTVEVIGKVYPNLLGWEKDPAETLPDFVSPQPS
jgi:hypothetical protein